MPDQPLLDRRVFSPGETIFKEGQHGSVAYIVQKGTVDLWRGDKLIAVLTENAIFGEMALIDGAPRMATAKARDLVTAIVLPKGLFDAKLRGADPFIGRLLQILVTNVRNFAHLVD